jgi:hypothetical protein
MYINEKERLHGPRASTANIQPYRLIMYIDDSEGTLITENERLRGMIATENERLRGMIATENERLRGMIATENERMKNLIVKF